MHTEIIKVVSRLMNLKRGSEYYEELILNGIPSDDIDKFIAEGNSLKSPDSRKFNASYDLGIMFDLDGWITGGGALSHIFKTHQAPDYDIFFSDPITYARAMLIARKMRSIDVCYSPGKPYLAFDLAVAKCSFKRDEFDIDETCLDAIESGVSDICPGSIINANATLNRMMKYHRYMGMKFKQEQVIAMCSVHPVDMTLAKKVLQEVT